MLFDFLTNVSASDALFSADTVISASDAVVSEAASNDFFANVNIDPGRFIEMLPKLGIGMISIFIVIGVIIIVTSLLNKIFSKKKKKAE